MTADDPNESLGSFVFQEENERLYEEQIFRLSVFVLEKINKKFVCIG
jgi:hypothetical protein